jgi:DNA-binding transcriptional ArsR family regulator
MIYLKPYLKRIELIEAWPKLTIAALAEPLGLSKRTVSAYRRLEEGVQAREDILEALVQQRDVFVYDKDIRKLAMNLSAFDAFLCAYTALLSDLEQTADAPPGFPKATGWVHYPILSHR